MSGRSPPTGDGRFEGNTDDVETYRQLSRQNDRRYREHDREHDREEGVISHQRELRSSNHGVGETLNRQKKLTLDREQRMSRLREEIKKEDETLAALDSQQAKKKLPGSLETLPTDLKRLPQETVIQVYPEELEGLDEEEQMRKLLGIDGFGSTKGEAVDDNQSTAARGGAAKNKARKYRQYMNRKNGFNRPLEKMN